MFVNRFALMNISFYRDQKRALDSIELELQAVRSCQTWILETELRSSARAIFTLNAELSPAP